MILAETYMDSDNKTSRRSFLTGSAAGVCAFDIIPGSVFAQPAPSDRINFGHIGIGGRGSGFLRAESGGPTKPSANLGGTGDRTLRPARSVALCDVDTARLDKAATRVGGHPKLYKDFRRLLDDKDVDAVFIATPDQWHALMAIMACEAGKDVYMEKPAYLTIEEGRAMMQAAERYRRVASGLAGALTARGVSRLRLHSQWPDRHGAESHLLALRQSNRRLDRDGVQEPGRRDGRHEGSGAHRQKTVGGGQVSGLRIAFRLAEDRVRRQLPALRRRTGPPRRQPRSDRDLPRFSESPGRASDAFTNR